MGINKTLYIQSNVSGITGLENSSLVTSSKVKDMKVIKEPGKGRKMIIRVADIGFSNVCNIGAFETIENGVATSADIMLDSPGTIDALERLKDFPWISVGWHMHMWGAPALNPKDVPSLVEKGGQFDGRFRLDLSQADDVNYDEAISELRAQLDRCIKILGRVPDTGGGGRGDTPWRRACKQVHDEYGIVYGFSGRAASDQRVINKIKTAQAAGEEWAKYYSANPSPFNKADEKWQSRNIVQLDSSLGYIELYTDSISEVEATYDPVLYFTEDRAGILNYPDDVILLRSWHPGYVDYYVYRLGERGNRARAQQFVVGRTQDASALCDLRLKKWIKENNIELINTRDALYETREYQNHLKIIDSDLAV